MNTLEAVVLAKQPGIRVRRVKIITFATTGFAAGLAMEREAIAATIIGGTSIYGGQGAI